MKNNLVTLLILVASAMTYGLDFSSRIIGGAAISASEHPEVMVLQTGQSQCTATAVGPRVVLTTAHCIAEPFLSEVKLNGIEYSVETMASSHYDETMIHDVAAIILKERFSFEQFATVGGDAKVGAELVLLGYGCTKPYGDGENGKLHKGTSEVSGFADLDVISEGASLCFGDSGGPAYAIENGTAMLLGLGSKGNIVDTNYHTRLDIPESQEFFQQVVDKFNVSICGFNTVCAPIKL